MAQYDALIIGGGHNGLVCGTYLARAGLKVLVLERRPIFGGAAVTEEIRAGLPRLDLLLCDEPAASAHHRGLGAAAAWAGGAAGERLFCPLDGDDYLVFCDDMQKTQAEFRAVLEARRRDLSAVRQPTWRKRRTSSAALLLETPVDPTRRDWRSFKQTASLLWRHRRIGSKFYRIVDLLTHERLRLSVGVVRERRHQGGVRLLRLDRHFRRTEDRLAPPM